MADTEITVHLDPDGDVHITSPGADLFVCADGSLIVDALAEDEMIRLGPAMAAEVVEQHPLTADLRRQLEQARGIAVQLEQQLAEFVTVTQDLVVADDGQVWWVSPLTGESVALGPGSLRLRLAQVVATAEAVTSRG